MERWSGRVALVTGASSGIGAAIAEKLVKSGMKVFACARNIGKIEEMKKTLAKDTTCKGTLFPIRCDLTKEEDILSMFATIKETAGGVDVCVNNAGLGFAGDNLMNGKTDHWRTMLQTNVLAYAIVTREAIQSMKSRNVDDGHIVYINSDSGYYTLNDPTWHFYEGTKHAVTAQAEGLRRELRLANTHIRVSQVSPGWVQTEFAKRAGGEEFHKQCLEAGNKPLQPDDIADAVMYVVAAPPHVQVFNMLMYGTEESV
ncbi:dehydrogenase/reductase SDR family member 11-like [Lineus longissimus]|uniref:dehydrogenase/reductase SDR family member 11-like n=1 Tax=Lineus longissimus TaxID=88925 RepID=UPI002B4DADAE